MKLKKRLKFWNSFLKILNNNEVFFNQDVLYH